MPYADRRIEIRDFRNGDWYWVNKQVLTDERLTHSTKIVYSAIASFANEKQSAFPSLSSIEKRADCRRATAVMAIKALEKHGYIGVKRLPGKVNRYTLLKVVQKLNPPNSTSSMSEPHQFNKNTSATPRLVQPLNPNKKERIYNKKGINLLRKEMKTLGLK